MKKINLRVKLIIAFLVSGLLPVMFLGLYNFYSVSSTIEDQMIDKLVTVKNIKGEAIKRYFEGIRDQVITFSSDVSVQNAMVNFSGSFDTFVSDNEIVESDIAIYKSKVAAYYTDEFGKKYLAENGKSANEMNFVNQLSGQEIAFQYYYIAHNSNPLGSKEVLDYAEDSSSYSQFHKTYHPYFREFLQKFGYYDIFLVDINSGHIVYSVFKELDYATSLLTGPYKDTNFAEAFRKAKDLTSSEQFVLVDYKKYTPSYEAPASFIASPIFKDGEKVGVAIFQMPIDRLNAIMGERSGLGQSGESYLIGNDYRFRSDSFADSENYNVVSSFKNEEKGTALSHSIKEVLAGNSGHGENINYLGQKVVSAYSPIDILGLKWGLIADISSKEAFGTIKEMTNVFLIITALSCLFIFMFSFYLSSSLAKAIQSIADRINRRTAQVRESSVHISKSSNELSSATVQQASSLQETVSSIDEISSMVSRNAETAQQSTEISNQSRESAKRGKDTVEVMIKSINEIANSNEEIASAMNKNNEDITQIVQVISEIGEKTKVINDIVFQTKLLSFNASVEAARAGEHGKGFAVVAEEVGNLASMSGSAALEITEMLDNSIKQVTTIVDSTKKQVEALIKSSKEKVDMGTSTASECGQVLDEILMNVANVNDLVNEIAAASSEQSEGVKEVTRAMRSLDNTTHKNTAVANESSKMAKNLDEQAEGLTRSVGDLVGVVTGQVSQREILKSIKKQGHIDNKSNVVNLISKKKNEPTKEIVNEKKDLAILTELQESAEPLKKASGLDISIPDSSDNRFEDL